MNIIISVQYKLNDSLIGGMDRFCWSFNEKLVQNGHDVTWYFPKSLGFKNYSERGLKMVFIDDEDFLQGVYYYLEKYKIYPDILITHFTRYFTKELLWFKRHGVKKIISFEHLYKDLNSRTLLQRIKFLIKGFLYLKYCDKIGFVSQYVMEQGFSEFKLNYSLKHKSQVVYNGVDVDLFKNNGNLVNINDENKVLKIIIACRIVKAKGIEFLLEAINELGTDNRKRVILDIYGDGVDKNNFINYCHKNELFNVNFRGNINNLHSVIPNYDIAILPSLGEALPFFILESMACGVPVIATNIGGIPEIINSNNGWLIETKSSIAIRELIFYLLKNRSFVHQKGANSRIYVLEKFNLNLMVENHYNFIFN